MAGSIQLNPYLTTNAAGSFNVSSEGYVQGVFLDDPAIRNELAGGTFDPNATKPLWGGCAVSELIRAGAGGVGTDAGYTNSLGGVVGRATTVTQPTGANASLGAITGFSVFNQMYNGITTPQSPVPTFGPGSGVGFFRLGSGARIPVAIEPSLVSADGYLITSLFSWDFNDDMLVAYDASTATVSVTSLTYATTNGGQIAVVAAAATAVGAIGDVVNISGATSTGTGGATAVNGNFVVNTFTDNQHFTIAATNAGGATYYGTIAGTILINQGIGIVPVKVLETQIGNSMTVVWDPVNQVATWNRSGSTAIILI